VAIIIKSILHDGKFVQFIGRFFFMWLNDDGKWEELKKGYMERDSAAAIENASLIQRM